MAPGSTGAITSSDGVHLVVNEHDLDDTWAVELTTPETNHSAAVFPPLEPAE